MPRYSYRAYNQSGALLSGAIDVASRDAALQALASRGHMAVEVHEAAEALTQAWWQREVFAAKALNDDERLALTRELATLLKAELPLDEALGVVALMPGLSVRARALASRILDRVREGQSLSLALSAEGSAFPDFYWRLVKAGETGGSLGDVMGDLSAFLDRGAELKNRVTSALLYPMLLIAAAIAAVLVIMLVLLPAVMPLFEGSGAEPPAVLRILASVQSAAQEHWQIAAALLGVLAVALSVLKNDAGFRNLRHEMILKMPVAGRMAALKETGRFCRTMSALLKNGVPLLEALRSTAGVLTNTVYARNTSAMADGVAEGVPLSRAMQGTKLFSELSVRLAAVGERTGDMDAMLARAAEIHETMLEREVDRKTRLIGPLLTLFIGLFTGGLILSVMQAILSINDLALK